MNSRMRRDFTDVLIERDIDWDNCFGENIMWPTQAAQISSVKAHKPFQPAKRRSGSKQTPCVKENPARFAAGRKETQDGTKFRTNRRTWRKVISEGKTLDPYCYGNQKDTLHYVSCRKKHELSLLLRENRAKGRTEDDGKEGEGREEDFGSVPHFVFGPPL